MEPAAQQTTTYTLNWVVGPDGTGKLVLTNSLLPLVPCEGNALPCHDSHTQELCSAKMSVETSKTASVISLKLTSTMFDGEIAIQVKFDPSFLDLLIDETTKVFFPLPNEKPRDYGMITQGDKNGNVFLMNPNLPVVEMIVAVRDIPMESIKYTLPKDKSLKKSLPKESKTPSFVKTNDGSVCHCTLPEECLSSMQCHNGHVPLKCLAKLAWSQMSESGCMTSVLLISSILLETPIYVQINHDHSFLEIFVLGEIKVFFPLPIPKKTYSVEVNDIDNFKFKCLKGMSGDTKKSERAEKKERMIRGEIGYDCDDPLPTKHNVQRPNQVWSIVSNCWELIRKPQPRNCNWNWNDSTAGWMCEIDPTTTFLKKFVRTLYSNCWPK
jgi:hypothetical protein